MLGLYLLQSTGNQNKTLLIVVLGLFGFVILYFSLKTIETVYIMRKKKPLFVHFYIFKRRLKPNQIQILESRFTFYKRLSPRQKSYFEHRVTCFMRDKTFIGQKGMEITDEVKILISATAVMLTFGFRDYFIGLINRIIVFPSEFYSNLNQDYHKGELNPKLKALVLSWEHFEKGYAIENDKLNVGIHEFTHAIHLNSRKERDVSSNIFQDSYKELVDLLSNDKALRDKLIKSKYFRSYAYTNQYEFIAVIIESFIESPSELRSSFPKIYAKVKQMLNFNFEGY